MQPVTECVAPANADFAAAGALALSWALFRVNDKDQLGGWIDAGAAPQHVANVLVGHASVSRANASYGVVECELIDGSRNPLPSTRASTGFTLVHEIDEWFYLHHCF